MRGVSERSLSPVRRGPCELQGTSEARGAARCAAAAAHLAFSSPPVLFGKAPAWAVSKPARRSTSARRWPLLSFISTALSWWPARTAAPRIMFCAKNEEGRSLRRSVERGSEQGDTYLKSLLGHPLRRRDLRDRLLKHVLEDVKRIFIRAAARLGGLRAGLLDVCLPDVDRLAVLGHRRRLTRAARRGGARERCTPWARRSRGRGPGQSPRALRWRRA